MDLSIKTSVRVATWLLAFCPLMASGAEIVYAPSACLPSEMTVWVSNKTNQMQRVWMQTRETDLVEEKSYDLNPREQIKVPATEFLRTPKAFSVKTWDRGVLQVETQCWGEDKVLLTSSVAQEIDHYLTSSTTHVKLTIVNLFPNPQAARLQFFNRSNQIVKEEPFHLGKYYETQAIKLTVPAGATRLHISAEARLHSQVQLIQNNQFKLSPGIALAPVILNADSQQVYFLVSTRERNPDQSFVIALSDPAKIATAREQIRNPQLEKIIVGGITLGNGGFNRAFGSSDRAPYSWSVYRVDAFADFAHIDCDGGPDSTEERLPEKLNAGGRICFWHYRVTKELTLDEVRSGRLRTSLTSTKP